MSQLSADSRRRDKPILSCSFCRVRKLRCDRKSPCSACVRQGRPTECAYSSSEQERKDAVDYRPHIRGQRTNQRIARLENLVTQIRNGEQRAFRQTSSMASPNGTTNAFATPAPHSEEHLPDTIGKLSLTDDHEVYTGGSHWVTILEEIRHLKDELYSEYSDGTISQEPIPFDAASIQNPRTVRISLLNSAKSLPREQIVALMPARKTVDRHVSHFFNSFDFACEHFELLAVLNRRKFLTEYINFWLNPSAAPTIWIGLLFSVMSISALLQQQSEGSSGSSDAELPEILHSYRNLTIQCLLSGDYLRPSKYTIETLTLHFALDQNTNFGTDISNWVLIGVVVRIALRMGLHRDPSHWPNIPPMQAELRRRLWVTLYQMDFFTSTQVGLPRIVKDSQCDVRSPAHILDDDFYLFPGVIPAERPSTDHTPLLYIIQRYKIIKIAAEIYDTTEGPPPSPATIAELRAKLDRAVDAIPAWLKYQSLETCIAENPVTIMHRIFLDILIHKAVYLLHRRSFVKSTVSDNSKSNELCIEAALAILGHQRRISEETQPGGLLFEIRWKAAPSVTHEFLQATMMLCFALSELGADQAAPADSCALYRRDDIVQALQNAKSLWAKNSSRSVEAQRAVRAITTVLKQEIYESDLSMFEAAEEPSDGIQGFPSSVELSNFNSSVDSVLDPSLFAADEDLTMFGSLLDDFMCDNLEELSTGVLETSTTLQSSSGDTPF